MTDPWQEISAWPFVVPLATVAWAVLLYGLHRRASLNLPRALLAGFLCVYGAGVVAYTMFPIFVGKSASDLPRWETMNLVPLVGTEPFDMLQNVIVFLPVGFLVPLLTRGHSVRRVIVWGFLLSLAIETAQVIQAGIGQGGHVGDVNDLLANCLGAPLGYGLFLALLHVPLLDRLAAATAWPARSGHTAASPLIAAGVRTGP